MSIHLQKPLRSGSYNDGLALDWVVFVMFAEAGSLAWLKAKLAGIWRTIAIILSAIGLIELSIEQLSQNNKDYQNSIDNTESTIASMQTLLNTANNVRR